MARRAVNLREPAFKSKPPAMRSVRQVALGAEIKFPARRTLKDMDEPRLADEPNRNRETHGRSALLHCGGALPFGNWTDIDGLRRWREHVESLCRRLPGMPNRWWMLTCSD
jgi:hypothetical protein